MEDNVKNGAVTPCGAAPSREETARWLVSVSYTLGANIAGWRVFTVNGDLSLWMDGKDVWFQMSMRDGTSHAKVTEMPEEELAACARAVGERISGDISKYEKVSHSAWVGRA